MPFMARWVQHRTPIDGGLAPCITVSHCCSSYDSAVEELKDQVEFCPGHGDPLSV